MCIGLRDRTIRSSTIVVMFVIADEKPANGHELLSEPAFFQGAAGKGHRPELTPPAAAILREIDFQVWNHATRSAHGHVVFASGQHAPDK